MHHLVVHRKNEDVVKETGHEQLQPGSVLAVDMSFLADLRRIGLRLNGGRADDTDAVRRQRSSDVANETILVRGRDMFQYIDGINAVK